MPNSGQVGGGARVGGLFSQVVAGVGAGGLFSRMVTSGAGRDHEAVGAGWPGRALITTVYCLITGAPPKRSP